MKAETEIINIMDFPEDLFDSVCEHLSHFSVALLRINFDQNYEDIQLIGSGTLVTVNGYHSILTAEHVIAELKDSHNLGLLTSYRGNPHRYSFDKNHLNIHRIAKGINDSDGPDIGLIVLPQQNIGRLKAEKSFFNVDNRRDRFRIGFMPINRGFWFTKGFPGEFEIYLEANRGFNSIKGYFGLCGISGIRKKYESSDYDYLEMSIEYESHNQNLPTSFGGVSGGGVWQVPLVRDRQGNLEADEYILSGVVFYQTKLDGNHRLIRCHGRKTVYEKVPKYLNGILSS